MISRMKKTKTGYVKWPWLYALNSEKQFPRSLSTSIAVQIDLCLEESSRTSKHSLVLSVLDELQIDCMMPPIFYSYQVYVISLGNMSNLEPCVLDATSV